VAERNHYFLWGYDHDCNAEACTIRSIIAKLLAIAHGTTQR